MIKNRGRKQDLIYYNVKQMKIDYNNKKISEKKNWFITSDGRV